jgi:hypothetical protein
MLIFTGLLCISCLLGQLLLDGGVLPVDLFLLGVSHFLNDFLGLFGAEMRLVIQFLDFMVGRAFCSVPVHLLAEVVLVLAHRLDSMLMRFFSLRLAVFDLSNELTLFLFTELLQTDEFKFIAAKSLERSLILNSHITAVICQWNVAQSTIVHRERTL